MSRTVKLLDEDREEEMYTVPNGVKIPLADGSGMATAYFVEGTLPITANGTYDVTDKAAVDVHVPSGGGESNFAALIDKSITAVTAADLAGITTIGEYAFFGCYLLTSLALPDSITRIEEAAFMNCVAVHVFSMGSAVISIGQEAFSGFGATGGGLGILALPDSVAFIGDYAFNDTGWESFEVGTGAVSIGSCAFRYNADLLHVTIKAASPPYAGSDLFDNCPNLAAIYVPAASVAAYKAAAGWSTYASLIQAIPT